MELLVQGTDGGLVLLAIAGLVATLAEIARDTRHRLRSPGPANGGASS